MYKFLMSVGDRQLITNPILKHIVGDKIVFPHPLTPYPKQGVFKVKFYDPDDLLMIIFLPRF
jgi:hypothetical protein